MIKRIMPAYGGEEERDDDIVGCGESGEKVVVDCAHGFPTKDVQVSKLLIIYK